VRDFLEVCPGIITESGAKGDFHKSIRAAMDLPDKNITEEKLHNIVRAINWRDEQLNFANNIVQLLKLKRPYDQAVRTWFAPLWETKHLHCSDRYQQAYKALVRAKIFEVPEVKSVRREYGYEWYRPREYVAASVALSSRDTWEVSVRVCQIVEVYEMMIRDLVEQVTREPGIQAMARAFYEKLE
jgi:hypothetical protein